jgi:hypothetical protein
MGERIIVTFRQSLFLGKRASCKHKTEWLDMRLRKRITAFLPGIRPYLDHPHLTGYTHILTQVNWSNELKYHDSLLLYSCTVISKHSCIILFLHITFTSEQQCTERHPSSHIYDGDKISHRCVLKCFWESNPCQFQAATANFLLWPMLK